MSSAAISGMVMRSGPAGRVGGGPWVQRRFRLLGQVQCCNGMLAHGLLILIVQFRIFIFDDLAKAHLGQLFRHQFFIEQAPFNRPLVLNESRDDLVQVFLANALRFLALRLGKPLDLDLEFTAFLIEADIAFVRIITAIAIIEARRRLAFRALRREIETGREYLFHEQARRNGFQCIVDCFRHGLLGRIRFGNQISETRAGFARGITCRAANDLNDLRQAGAIAYG